MSSSVADSARRRRKDARPQELLEAALALFVDKGFAATRAEEVAQAAGVSKGTLYLYFQSKEDLLKAVITHFLSQRIVATLGEIAQHTGACAPVLRERLADWWIEACDSPASGVFKLIISEVRNFPEIGRFYEQEVVTPAHTMLAALVRRGIANGEFRPLDADLVVNSLILPLVMLCVHRHSLSACVDTLHGDAAQFIRHHVNLVVDGLMAPGPDAASAGAIAGCCAPAPSPAASARTTGTSPSSARVAGLPPEPPAP